MWAHASSSMCFEPNPCVYDLKKYSLGDSGIILFGQCLSFHNADPILKLFFSGRSSTENIIKSFLFYYLGNKHLKFDPYTFTPTSKNALGTNPGIKVARRADLCLQGGGSSCIARRRDGEGEGISDNCCEKARRMAVSL